MNTKQEIDSILNKTDFSKKDWECIVQYFNNTQKGFVTYLKEAYPDLSQDDIYIILLICLDVPNSRIAIIFHIQMESLRKRRYRIMQKMRIEGETCIVRFLRELYQK